MVQNDAKRSDHDTPSHTQRMALSVRRSGRLSDTGALALRLDAIEATTKRVRSGQVRLQRVPLAVDPGADEADDRDHRDQQDPEQHGVFDKRRPVLVLLEPERILLELVQKHH